MAKYNSAVALLEDWRKRMSENQKAHILISRKFNRLHYALGFPVVILSTIVGTSIVGNFQNFQSISVRVILGILSVSAAVLSALQTLLKYSERCERHRIASVKFGAIRREIDQILALTTSTPIVEKRIDKLRSKIDETAELAPPIAEHILRKYIKKKHLSSDTDIPEPVVMFDIEPAAVPPPPPPN